MTAKKEEKVYLLTPYTFLFLSIIWIVSDEVVGSSDEELSCGEAEASAGQDSLCGPPDDKNLKEVLLRKYSGYLSSLRKEFLKKRKNGKLPKDARTVLLDWWNSHYRWPYPTVISVQLCLWCCFLHLISPTLLSSNAC